MVTDGGGWTVAFAGQNGSPNVFDHFDATDSVADAYRNICTDPATHCLRRLPRGLDPTTTEVAVSCGNAIVKFRMPGSYVYDWLTNGTQANWQPIAFVTSIGAIPVNPSAVPHYLWTGGGQFASFIFFNDLNQARSPSLTFASSYSADTSFDGCNGLPDTSSLVQIMFR